MPINMVEVMAIHYQAVCDWCSGILSDTYGDEVFDDKEEMWIAVEDQEWAVPVGESYVLCSDCAVPEECLLHGGHRWEGAAAQYCDVCSFTKDFLEKEGLA